MKISVIVPVYNGEKTIEKLNEELLFFFSKESYEFELIYVYDNGKDYSLEKLRKIKNQYPSIIKLIVLSRNFGQHNAIICGFEYAEGDFIVTMDEDLQHSPSDISKLIRQQRINDSDLVYATSKKLKHSFFRGLTSRILKKILSFSIPELNKNYSAFRLIKKEIALETVLMKNSYTFLDGYLSWITSNVDCVYVNHKERYSGESSYNIKKLIEHSLSILITFSNLPIRFLSFSSIFIFIITLLYTTYVVIRKITYNDFIAGYPTLIITIGLGVSFILMGLGVIGEYIYRINLKTTNQPNYVIKK